MLVIDLASVFVVLTIFVYNVLGNGEYVPKSIYLLDQHGQKTDEFHVRNRRDLEFALQKFKRSPGNQQSGGSAHSYSGSYSNSGHGESYIPDLSNLARNIDSGLDDIRKQSEGFANIHGRSGYAPNANDLGYDPNANNLGYKGPILFSRSGVDKGTGVRVAGAAQGPRGAFSSSSSSIDGHGNIKYDVKSGKY